VAVSFIDGGPEETGGPVTDKLSVKSIYKGHSREPEKVKIICTIR